MSETMRTKGVLPMKKEYMAPLVKYLAFSVEETIANTTDDTMSDPNGSKPWNDGELGWT